MKSETKPSFWRTYKALPAEVRLEARRVYRLWLSNPEANRLQFKPIQALPKVYSIRIGGSGHRALGLLQGDTVTWFWIGSHDE